MRLFDQVVLTAEDVFALRQRSREVAEVAGFDAADQVRLATALSELGRDLIAPPATGGSVEFTVDIARGELVVRCDGFTSAAIEASAGLGAARRLLSWVAVVSSADGADAIEIRQPLAIPATATSAEAMRAHVVGRVVISPLDELRAQNRELLGALEELTARHDELVALNAELDQTNQGVMAMYAQLSEELETTNRGVVALYAELDEKSQRLQATTEARSRFLNNVSHELRSPVTSIVGLSRLLLEPDGAPALEAEQRHQVELVARTGGELLALVNQLLDLARAEFGRLEPEIDRVDIAELVGHVVDALRPLAREGVDVFAGPGNRIVALTDATLLRQVLRNLVANALAFTREGAVEVRTTRDPGASITIDVVDSGIGIDPANLERVFEEFFQVRGPHQADRKGSGLGLAYSRRVTELLGGTLSVVSEPGRGSTFTVRLPDRVAAESTGDEAPARRLTRVLVADDDASFRATLRTMLHGVADEVVEVADGQQALNRLAQVRFDVVILDLMMPNLDGHGVLAAMADEPELRDVPVVVVTSLDVARADAPRAAAVLGKRQLTAAALLACIVGLGLEERGR